MLLQSFLPIQMMLLLLSPFIANHYGLYDPPTAQKGFRKIFDGKTFNGWEGDRSVWRIENGCLIGEVTPEKPIKTNSFLIWRGGEPADFEFKTEYRINKEGNSGINYRSEELPDIKYAVKGYQADIDGENTYTGQNYEERGRGFLAMRGQRATLEPGKPPVISKDAVVDAETLKGYIRKYDWNEIHLVVKGNNMKHYINGILMSETTDLDPALAKSKGVLSLQAHVGERMKVEFRNVRLKD